MNENIVNRITDRWQEMISAALNLENIPAKPLQCLLKDSYEALYFYHQSSLIPKELSRMLLEMEEFLYFAELMEKNEVGEDFYHIHTVYTAIKGMENGFFAGEYASAFPVLTVTDPKGTVRVLDLENGSLEE